MTEEALSFSTQRLAGTTGSFSTVDMLWLCVWLLRTMIIYFFAIFVYIRTLCVSANRSKDMIQQLSDLKICSSTFVSIALCVYLYTDRHKSKAITFQLLTSVRLLSVLPQPSKPEELLHRLYGQICVVCCCPLAFLPFSMSNLNEIGNGCSTSSGWWLGGGKRPHWPSYDGTYRDGL